MILLTVGIAMRFGGLSKEIRSIEASKRIETRSPIRQLNNSLFGCGTFRMAVVYKGKG
jgi:hypothetical protein